uniref:Uncharacterized protein n=1 Tax=Arundo donax TaxID=35708 RepID=A0A0A9A801_ARUDO
MLQTVETAPDQYNLPIVVNQTQAALFSFRLEATRNADAR